MTSAMHASDWRGSRGDRWRDHIVEMEAMLAPIDAPLVQALAINAPCRVADIGCGGGTTSRAVYAHAPNDTIVHGFDISPTLVEHARRRLVRDTAPLSFDVADVSTTAAPGTPYDRLVSRFGVMFFDDAPRAFTNLFAWLVPGGRFAFAVWGPGSENAWMSTVRDAVASVIDVPKPEPDSPGPFRYADAPTFEVVLTGAGFVDVHTDVWHGSLAVCGGMAATDAATCALSAFSVFSDLLAAAGDGAHDRAHRALTSAFARHERDGTVQLNATVHIVTGARV